MNTAEKPWNDLLARLGSILVYRKGEQRAPHKPLYILYCIASIQKGLPRLQKFESVRAPIKEALKHFGLRTNTFHPEYPFWRLQNDELAVVEVDKPIEFRKSNDDPKVSSLLSANARGGLLERDFKLLADNLNLQSMAVHKILDAHFPASIHDEIIRHFDLVLQDPHSRDSVTEKVFRNHVLSEYGNKCALTGFSLKFAGDYAGVEAAHICWPQAGGNDEVCNGIAMSTLHRKLYHLGLFTINDNYETLVSSEVDGNADSIIALKKLHGLQINLPHNATSLPSKDNLKWHMRWVYRG